MAELDDVHMSVTEVGSAGVGRGASVVFKLLDSPQLAQADQSKVAIVELMNFEFALQSHHPPAGLQDEPLPVLVDE